MAPGRRVRAVSAHGVRSCAVAAPSAVAVPARGRESEAPVPVVDDVPAWALFACGAVVAVVMLLALLFVGGPTYL